MSRSHNQRNTNTRKNYRARYKCNNGGGLGYTQLENKEAKREAGAERRSSGKTQIRHGLLEMEAEEYQQCG